MPYLTTTLAELRTQLQTTYDAIPFWTATEADNALNEALQTYNLLTGFWKRRIVYTTVAGEVWITVPGTLTYNLRVAFNEQVLDPDSIAAMDLARRRWESETTTSGGDVPTRPRVWMPNGLNELAIWPADAAGQNSLVIDGLAATPVLTSDTQYLDLGQEDIDALVNYALHVLTLKLGGARFQGMLPKFGAFLTACADRNARLRGSNYFRWLLGRDWQTALVPLRAAGAPVPTLQPAEAEAAS